MIIKRADIKTEKALGMNKKGKEMENQVVRLLRANEIECRVATISEKGLSLLLYKDARVDQKILDETFGIFGWKRSHESINGSLYCTVEVLDKESGQWIGKQDVGAIGSIEKEKSKSQASDSFKRACFNWGIGRELYTAPFIWIPAGKADIQIQGERYLCKNHFSVASIAYNDNREIVSLLIQNEKKIPVYEFSFTGNKRIEKAEETKGEGAEEKQKRENGREKLASVSKGQIEAFQKELKRTGVSMEAVQDRYQIKSPNEMSEKLYKQVMSALAKTKSAAAA